MPKTPHHKRIPRSSGSSGVGPLSSARKPITSPNLRGCNPASMRRAVALLTKVDLVEGSAGGLGLIELAACVQGVDILRYFRDSALDGVEGGHGSGRSEMFARARQRAFDMVFVSTPASLGDSDAEVRRALWLLNDLRIAIYAGRIGHLTDADLP